MVVLMDKNHPSSRAWRKRVADVLAELRGPELSLREVLAARGVRSASQQHGPDAVKRWRAAHSLKLLKR
jgi:hypothetical protein